MKIPRLFFNKEFLIINAVLVIYLVIISTILPYGTSDDLILFAPDSQTYYHTGGEFFQLSQQGHSIIRPFLYSTILKVLYDIGGAWMVVVFHALCWIASANFIYFGIKFITNHLFTRLIAVGFFMANISLITYIQFGLTELVTVFLLSWACFLVLKTFKDGFSFRFWLQILLIFALLCVVKPLFQYPFLVILLFGVIRFGKTLFTSKRNSLLFGLILTPLILQLGVMYYKYGVFRISMIDTITFERYFLAQSVREIHGIEDVKASQKIVYKMTDLEKKAFISKNRDRMTNQFLKNVESNILATDSSFIIPEPFKAKSLSDYMNDYNLKLFLYSKAILKIFLLISLIDLVFWKWIKYWQQWALGAVLYYIVFGSGISFYQGDRLVVFSIPVWICLYVVLAYRLIETDFWALFKRKSERALNN